MDAEVIEKVDQWLDEGVNSQYTEQPLAQDWARVAKVIEELGEAVSEMILFTGQNPRKGIDSDAYDRLLAELGDVALTAVLAIQHFTKNIERTAEIIITAEAKVWMRMKDLSVG